MRTEAAAKETAQIKAQQKQAEKNRRLLETVAPSDLQLQLNAVVSMSLKDRIAVYGMTGTGKTTWARQLLPRFWVAVPRVATNIIDSKGQHEYDDLATRIHVGSEAPEPARAGEVLVWVIPGRVDKAALDEFLHRVLAAGGPSITLADEIANFGDGDSFVEGADLLLKQGRFGAQMFIGMSQQYAGNSRNLFGQSTHVLRFHLLNPYDGRELNRVMGIPSQPRRPPREPASLYGFFYRRVDRPSPAIEYSGWQEFFRF